jgi:hypothetical protein
MSRILLPEHRNESMKGQRSRSSAPREVSVESLTVASVVLSAVGVGLGLAGVILGVASLVRRHK